MGMGTESLNVDFDNVHIYGWFQATKLLAQASTWKEINAFCLGVDPVGAEPSTFGAEIMFPKNSEIMTIMNPA